MSAKNPQVFQYVDNFRISQARRVLKFHFGKSFIRAYKDKQARVYRVELIEPKHKDEKEQERLTGLLFEHMRKFASFWGDQYQFEFAELISKE